MKEKDKKKQIAKISVFITSIFVIFLSATYAFINQTLTGTKRQVITAGNLSLELQEDENNLTITDAMPMYDEVGMIQEAFTFRLVNKIDVDTNYIVKLEKIIVADPLDESLVKYGLMKDEEVTIDFVSNIEENAIDSGTISGNQTIHYSLRLWIDSSVEDESLISSKSLSYKLNIEATQNTEVVQLPPATNTSELVSDKTDLGESCKTYNDGVDTFLVGQCQNNYVWYSGKLWRVVLKNNETGSVKMITDNAITAIPYNEEDQTTFENSYADQWLNQEFLPTLHDYQDYLVENSTWYDPRTKITTVRTVGLLNNSENTTIRKYTGDLNLGAKDTSYLNNGTIAWAIGSYDSGYAQHIYSFGGETSTWTFTYLTYGVRPTVNLKSNIQIISGNGSISEPYKLVGDEQEAIGGTTLLNTRYSGEYVNFNNELYRIVGVENNRTKIVSVDKPTQLENNGFGDVPNFITSPLKSNLENYYQNDIIASYKNMIEPNTTWYLGMVGDGENYKASICATVNTQTSTSACSKTTAKTTANIGLSRVGEMFASQITRNEKKEFNTLTPYALKSASQTLNENRGIAADNSLNTWFTKGARPSMYLKSTVRIARNNTGDGTYDNPYDIEL